MPHLVISVMNVIEEHQVVTITYELREDGPQGELLERMDANYPFIFLFGTGKLLKSFEDQLFGLGEEDAFEFVLSPEEAYGAVKSSDILSVPMHAFKIDGEVPPNMLVKGNYIALTTDEGQTFNGRILSWDDTQVRVDFNHAMAGKTLHFKGAVLNIRSATVDELVRQHYIVDDGLRRPDFGESSSFI